jgi:hypothetical protein
MGLMRYCRYNPFLVISAGNRYEQTRLGGQNGNNLKRQVSRPENTNCDKMLIPGGNAGSRIHCNNPEGTLRFIVFPD